MSDLRNRALAAAAEADALAAATPRPVIMQDVQEEIWVGQIRKEIYDWAEALGTTVDDEIKVNFSVVETGYDDREYNCPHSWAKFTSGGISFRAELSYYKSHPVTADPVPSNFIVFMQLPNDTVHRATTLAEYGHAIAAYEEAAASMPRQSRRKKRRDKRER